MLSNPVEREEKKKGKDGKDIRRKWEERKREKKLLFNGKNIQAGN